jgi:16S rRNA (cytosine1402-N4)-methyltransferase
VESENRDSNIDIEHISVLAEKLTELISLPTDGIMVDGTLGHGGHSLLFGQKLGPDGLLLGFDVDKNCIERAQSTLSSLQCRVKIFCENFAKMGEVLPQNGIEKVDMILADLGFCSAQMGDKNKGLSFQENMPLDMRLDYRISLTAADIVNGYDEDRLANVIFQFGQERASRKIARYIVDQRKRQKILTTAHLAALVCQALNQPVQGRRQKKTHPATKTFQALRIEVNSELQCLTDLLEAAPDLLRKDGKIAIISFHSLEDKIVKEDFKSKGKAGVYEIMTPKPLVACKDEVKSNPRARSAKLRIAVKK